MSENIWYVYRHRKLSNDEVFYIGISQSKNKRRAYRIEGRNNLWTKIHNKHGRAVEIIADKLTEEEAKDLEIFLISIYGRINTSTGTLANLTDGGDGTSGYIVTQEKIEKWRKSVTIKRGEEHPSWGYKHTEEANEKNRQAKLGKYLGWESPIAEPVVNTQTEEIYPSATEAFKFSGMESYDYFKSKLNGRSTNDTYFMYYKDYEKYGALEPKEIRPIKQEVRDTLTLKRYDSITEAAKDLGIKQSNLARYLSKELRNITYCVYEKDYVEGVIHYPIQPKPDLRVEDWNTNTIYKDTQEASEITGININTLKGYLSGRSPNAERNTFRYYTEE